MLLVELAASFLGVAARVSLGAVAVDTSLGIVTVRSPPVEREPSIVGFRGITSKSFRDIGLLSCAAVEASLGNITVEASLEVITVIASLEVITVEASFSPLLEVLVSSS